MVKTKFIDIEGIDGCGKTTMIELVANELRSNYGLRVATTKSLLADTIIGKAVREWIHTKDEKRVESAVLITANFLAGILEANEKLKQMIDSNEYDVIITDRWLLSTLVYAPAREDTKENNEFIHTLMNTVNEYIRKPDLTIFLECDVLVAADRIAGRDGKVSGDIFTNMDLLVHHADMYSNLIRTDYSINNYSNYYLGISNNDDDSLSALPTIVDAIDTLIVKGKENA